MCSLRRFEKFHSRLARLSVSPIDTRMQRIRMYTFHVVQLEAREARFLWKYSARWFLKLIRLREESQNRDIVSNQISRRFNFVCHFSFAIYLAGRQSSKETLTIIVRAYITLIYTNKKYI